MEERLWDRAVKRSGPIFFPVVQRDQLNPSFNCLPYNNTLSTFSADYSGGEEKPMHL